MFKIVSRDKNDAVTNHHKKYQSLKDDELKQFNIAMTNSLNTNLLINDLK